MDKTIDCIVAGSCVVDVLVRSVPLDKPIGRGSLIDVEPFGVMAGGIVANAGVAMARMGMKVCAMTCVGQDAWGKIVRDLFEREGLDVSLLQERSEAATSTTVVVIDESCERSFLHSAGAPRLMDAQMFHERMDTIASSQVLLLGYYSLMPNLEADLAEVFKAVRERGCKTALDAAGSGGGFEPLEHILPVVDVYVPSLSEAMHQTGHDDPRKIIEMYRAAGGPGLLGVKLGKKGVLLSPKAGDFIQVPMVQPPGEVVDTTGAGDCFYAGLLTGMLKGLSVSDAGRLGSAAGACCVTALGGSAGTRGYTQTAALAGL
ncbi:MAG: hypothetical protein GC164_08175 [Phycisphaera sp.]|nr:hypothetical protein [Phycisphaera sp.]